MAVSQAIIEEMECIRKQHSGVLHPAHVLEAARDERSAMHEAFDWNDSTASHKYRLLQAQSLIRNVTVTIVPRDNKEVVVRPYVSVSTDRKLGGGGYRHVDDVLADAELREQLLRDAFNELSAFQRKYSVYSDLEELNPVLDAIENAKEARAV